MSSRDYYCNHKFRFLKIDLESRITYNCHAAKPHRIDLTWLSSNPGQLFNNPVSVQEREQMLRNERNSSCEQNCWRAEDQGLPSPRLYTVGQDRTHTQVLTTPKVIDITLNTDCNLVCTYCSKENSTSWRNDLIQNGSYNIESEPDRYQLTNTDKILSKLSQEERFNAVATENVLAEISRLSPTAETIVISGGEPFLSRYLIDIVKQNTQAPMIKIFTGTGVNFKRFERLINDLVQYKNVSLALSIDCVGKAYEFNRYGMKWDDWLKKIELLQKLNMPFNFSSVISNLTVWNFAELYRLFDSYEFKIECVYNPNFLSAYIMDDKTKEQTMRQIDDLKFDKKQFILDSMKATPSEHQRKDLSVFLHEFVRRRPDLDLSVFPKTFQHWIEHVV